MNMTSILYIVYPFRFFQRYLDQICACLEAFEAGVTRRISVSVMW
jgi:hypothetical protein